MATSSEATSPSRAVTSTAISNMTACIDDCARAGLDLDPGPADPRDFNQLQGRLLVARQHLPPLYRATFADPYMATLQRLGQAGFNQVLLGDPNASMLMMDIAHAILQNGENFEKVALDAFQEVVSDLYDGFLSAEDRVGVKPPDKGIIAPLVKFGNPDFGPYTFPIEATESFHLPDTQGLGAGLVCLQPAQARMGLLGWAALGHETGGHDILSADTGLKAELASVVRKTLRDAGMPRLARYWGSRIDETASDVLGILNMGPAAGIGLIGFFRGLNQAFAGAARLRNNGPASDPHPADVLRGFLAAATVDLLDFADHHGWAALIQAETDKDVTEIILEGHAFSKEDAIRSAELVAAAIATTQLQSLEGTALIDIQNWRDLDEAMVTRLRGILTSGTPIPADLPEGAFAAHAVAAGSMAALAGSADIRLVFTRMLALLKRMHDTNPSFGPLFVAHPSDLHPHRAYVATA